MPKKKKQSHKIHKKKLTRLMQILKMHARMQNIITQTHISKKNTHNHTKVKQIKT